MTGSARGTLPVKMPPPAVLLPALGDLRQAREPGLGYDVFSDMKRIVAKCSEFDISVIVPVFEAAAVPPHGTMIAVECPACHVRHWMLAREMRVRNDQRAA